MRYPSELFTAFSFVAFILSLVPLSWHLKAWNTGICCFMIWAAVGNLNNVVNSIIWKGNVGDVAPVWCDISSRIFVALNVSLHCCALCVNRRLYYIATFSNGVVRTRTQIRRSVMVDLAIAVGIPLLSVALYSIPQDSRYWIYEDLGCYITVSSTWVGILLSSVWPPVLSGISFIYSILCFLAWYKRRKQFNEHLSSQHTDLPASQYIRLMCLASVDTIFTLPVSIWFLVTDLSDGVEPWVSIDVVHKEASQVGVSYASEWESYNYLANEVSKWAIVMCTAVFFMLFGFSDDARRAYRSAYISVRKVLGLPPPRNEKGGSSAGSSMTGSNGMVFATPDVNQTTTSQDPVVDAMVHKRDPPI